MNTHAIATIDALGGTTKVATAMKASVNTVQSWKKIGIPPSRMAHLELIAANKGVELPQPQETGESHVD